MTKNQMNTIWVTVFEKHWGKGFATESSQFCINLGFAQLGMKEIVGRVMAENIASIRVLEHVGMCYKETRTKME